MASSNSMTMMKSSQQQMMMMKKRKRKKEQQLSLGELKTLGEQLLSSRSHINNLPRLLNFIKHPREDFHPAYALESLLSLQSFFTPLLPDLSASRSRSSSSSSDASTTAAAHLIYSTWLRSKFDDFLQSLFSISTSALSDPTLREVVLETIMEFVKVANAGNFHSSIFHRFLHAIVHSTLGVGDILLQLLASKYFKYIDVRYFTYISLEKIARTLEPDDSADDKGATSESAAGNRSRASMEVCIRMIYHLLSRIPPLEVSVVESNYEMWSCVDAEDKQQKLRLHDRKVLATLHQAVIPHLSNPIMLCDFLTRSYDIGGVVSVMALSSLYILMTQHGLEYPNFYEKLYALLEPAIFMAKYRAKFFELIDSCLKSPLLPAYLAAAFCKKLSRLALSVPPSGALIIIALVHNLLRRHPSINFLVHQGYVNETGKVTSATDKSGVDRTDDTDSANKQGIDQFDDEQSDPMKTNAMRSSLWEIDTLRHHYCPPVSRFVLSLESDLTIRAKTSEVAVQDFSSGSYATIFGEEIRRRVKQVPLAFYKSTPTSLFSESDFPGWTFDLNDGEPVAVNDENGTLDTPKEHDHISVKRQCLVPV
ncbi:protein NUCLEOLAR COMPLEX ASSOCIATED 4 isoform X4 [Coffea arabica]|uniref:Protein NUCLEOLAR COMPLEX ASSOCIATED 4 isoform X4 n=1 Tax=Coffea arabica TaxID=13443 RepID=A0A6P6U8I1_COFAR|nr:nucleolar complex protein 4 homolog B-like isoform X5 [Coffea arabica]